MGLTQNLMCVVELPDSDQAEHRAALSLIPKETGRLIRFSEKDLGGRFDNSHHTIPFQLPAPKRRILVKLQELHIHILSSPEPLAT